MKLSHPHSRPSQISGDGLTFTCRVTLYILHCTLLYCTVLYCTVLYCTVLHSVTLSLIHHASLQCIAISPCPVPIPLAQSQYQYQYSDRIMVTDNGELKWHRILKQKCSMSSCYITCTLKSCCMANIYYYFPLPPPRHQILVVLFY